ncbi:uncharacterized, partial [Tachysurus ichikawai]
TSSGLILVVVRDSVLILAAWCGVVYNTEDAGFFVDVIQKQRAPVLG